MIEVDLPHGMSSLDDNICHLFNLLLFLIRSKNFKRICCKKQARIETKIKLWKTQEVPFMNNKLYLCDSNWIRDCLLNISLVYNKHI